MASRSLPSTRATDRSSLTSKPWSFVSSGPGSFSRPDQPRVGSSASAAGTRPCRAPPDPRGSLFLVEALSPQRQEPLEVRLVSAGDDLGGERGHRVVTDRLWVEVGH